MKITGQAGMRRQGRNGPGATRGQWVRQGQRTGRACERDVGHGGPQHSVRLKGGRWLWGERDEEVSSVSAQRDSEKKGAMLLEGWGR